MIIRRCKKLQKLDNQEISAVDRDLAKNFENNNNDNDMRPNTSVGIPHQNNKIEELFPKDNSSDENKEEEIKLPEDIIDNNLDLENKKEEVLEEIDTKIESIQLPKEEIETVKKEEKKEEKKENKKSNEIKENSINNKNIKDINANKKKITKNETLPSYTIKDKVISQVEYIPKNNNLKNKNVILIIYILKEFLRVI